MNQMHAITDPTALNILLHHSDVKILDASYGLGAPDAAYKGWMRERIGNAQFFDIDRIADPLSLLPHMLPTPEDFAAAVAALGISNNDRIIIYDQTGISMAAARVWWTFRVFGHDRVSVLDGGLPAWKAANLPVVTLPPRPPEQAGQFNAQFRPELVRALPDIRTALSDPDTVIVDARSAERFEGRVAEPRPGLRAGHIPGSINIPFPTLLHPVTGRLLPEAELQARLQPVARAKQLISTCGSGVTACVLALAMHTLGRTDVAVYDGSWMEWGAAYAGTPVA